VYLLRQLALAQRAWSRWNKEPVSTFLFDDANVSIRNQRFELNRVTVFVGESVFWGNDGATTHTVTSDTGAWSPLDLGQFESGVVTFDDAGVFQYHCEIHPSMTGRVTVAASS
jgi:plastocyanin